MSRFCLSGMAVDSDLSDRLLEYTVPWGCWGLANTKVIRKRNRVCFRFAESVIFQSAFTVKNGCAFCITSCCDIESSMKVTPPGPVEIGIHNLNVVKGIGLGCIYGIVLRSPASLSLILITPAGL
jgi:hypothetical protein